MTKFQFTLGLVAMIAAGSLFMDTPERQANRLDKRYNSAQALDTMILINHLNSPLPWTREVFQPPVPENVIALD